MKAGAPHLRIRSKFIGVLVLAAVVPVCIALLVFSTLGYRTHRKTLGQLHQVRAQHLALSLGELVRSELDSLDDWLAFSGLSAHFDPEASDAVQSEADLLAEVRALEQRWPNLGAGDSPLREVLAHPLAARLHEFRARHRAFVELFVTDSRGRLLAATAKTSDYWQADESWWQRGFTLSPRALYVEGIHFDDSADVYSLDVAVPVRDPRQPAGAPLGVLKGVINVTPLLSQAAPALADDEALRQVVLGDGRVLATLFAPAYVPLSEQLPEQASAWLRERGSGWLIADLGAAEKDFAGFAPLRLSGMSASGLEVIGATPMSVLVRQPASAVLAPLRQQIVLIVAGAAVCLFAFIVGGYLLATRKLIAPIESLREAVHRIADGVKIDADALPEPGSDTAAALAPLRRIQSRDELEALARDFAGMAQRVMGYNAHLQREVAAKTADIARDLELAREFQEALMPRSYPKVPTEAGLAPLSLDFHHLYQPASTVGGDFFDVVKLDDHRAGVFIADVMGHGARSALITAILRTLLQNLAAQSIEPAAFLATLNRHFHGIVRNSGETIFVSAFYLVLDLRTAEAHFASAGHPSPFRARRGGGVPQPLIARLQGNPALGLLPEARYQQWSEPVVAGDVFVLFTDGVHEAYNEAGEEFGLERMASLIESELVNGGTDLPAAIVAELRRFIAPASPADDICIVTLEVQPALVPEKLPA